MGPDIFQGYNIQTITYIMQAVVYAMPFSFPFFYEIDDPFLYIKTAPDIEELRIPSSMFSFVECHES